jgi:DNA uptake protein ComE-like DNA-binding protein
MKQFLHDYFSFNRVEIKGVRALLVLILVLGAAYLLLPAMLRTHTTFDAAPYQARVDSFMASVQVDTGWDADHYYYKKYNKTARYKQKHTAATGVFEMKPFDPNGLPEEIWVQMGLSEKQARVIKNYEAKGGRFKTKADVKKQFVISDDFYKKIEPYLVFAEINDEVVTTHAPLSVDLNHATQQDLMLLKGVKDYLAEGIIKYRQKLGGFTSVTQLKEVKYVSERIYADISPHCLITPYAVKKIKINLAEWKELAVHPYIGGDLANRLIDYRKKNGIFKNEEDFKKAGLVDEGLCAKLVPYLSFTH